jgi:hypothetical protein
VIGYKAGMLKESVTKLQFRSSDLSSGM